MADQQVPVFINVVWDFIATHAVEVTTATMAIEFPKKIGDVAFGMVVVVIAAVLHKTFTPLLFPLSRSADAQEEQNKKIDVTNQTIAYQTQQLETAMEAMRTQQKELVNAQNKANELQEARPKIKHPEPECFDGNPAHVESFLADLELYFQVTREAGDATKVIFALGKIKGGKDDCATKWARSSRLDWQRAEKETREAGEDQAKKAAVKWVFKNYDEFEKHFKENFTLFELKEDAQKKIMNIKMTGTCEEYTRLFNIYARDSKFDEETLLYQYTEGLNGALRENIRKSYPRPKTLEEWKDRALDYDKEYRRSKERKKETQGSNSRPNLPKPSSQRRDPDAMDIGALSAEERTKRFLERKCYNCNEVGHIARLCPKKGQNNREPSRGPPPPRYVNNVEAEPVEVNRLDTMMTMLSQMSKEDQDKLAERWNGNQGF
ncbi:hypothetical protein D9611_006160 [Ephemerocybe angulata]|uniref:CCHC-type domain-containing protein n=1 Tax=Ephemerocybe angulata TaxID=980116 RepID=A0A8H5FL50_9AGAR|nr:hypothetical protein D9611_006160 [Tulosesus angulatus]